VATLDGALEGKQGFPPTGTGQLVKDKKFSQRLTSIMMLLSALAAENYRHHITSHHVAKGKKDARDCV
jgi:hypothetical protein